MCCSLAMNYIFCFLVLLFCLGSCKPESSFFSKQTPHEKYGGKLKASGLHETALGQRWFSAAAKALHQPAKINLPYKEFGYLPAEVPRAAGLLFTAKRGQKLLFTLEQNPRDSFLLFAELWRRGEPSELVFSADTAQSGFDFTVDEDGEYILRLQPELLKSGDYTLSIAVAPSLGNPVAGNKGRIQSIWGDERDAGARRHEGIDIFAPFRTPVVAAADGMVTRVNENRLGGKVVWLRPKGRNLSLYYAHLDEQLVADGQEVKKGDTLGLIGNTGNARTTPPHLHFGIYAVGGAINPLPFVDPEIKRPLDFQPGTNELKEKLRLNKTQEVLVSGNSFSVARNVLLEPLAVTAKQYRVALPDGRVTVISRDYVSRVTNAVSNSSSKMDTYLLQAPDFAAPRIVQIDKEGHLSIYGYFNGYAYVSFKENCGWIHDSLLTN